MRYSMVITSSKERLAQRASCSSVIFSDSGDIFCSTASCLPAHSLPCALRLAKISSTVSAEKQRSMSCIIAGNVGAPGSSASGATIDPMRRCSGSPERSALASASTTCGSFALGT